jgi:hypothetical protein
MSNNIIVQYMIARESFNFGVGTMFTYQGNAEVNKA